jgi:hypothetical protein
MNRTEPGRSSKTESAKIHAEFTLLHSRQRALIAHVLLSKTIKYLFQMPVRGAEIDDEMAVSVGCGDSRQLRRGVSRDRRRLNGVSSDERSVLFGLTAIRLVDTHALQATKNIHYTNPPETRTRHREYRSELNMTARRYTAHASRRLDTFEKRVGTRLGGVRRSLPGSTSFELLTSSGTCIALHFTDTSNSETVYAGVQWKFT